MSSPGDRARGGALPAHSDAHGTQGVQWGGRQVLHNTTTSKHSRTVMEEIVLQGRAELCGGGLPPAHSHLVPGRGGETGGSLLVRENR